MKLKEMINYDPIPVQYSMRPVEIRHLTTTRGGKITPHKIFWLNREDSVRRGQVRMDFDMSETLHPLYNAIVVKAQVHFIPMSAFDRFSGMDALNRSYRGEKERAADAAPVPFFKTVAFDKTAPFWKALGVHWPNGTNINDGYIEAYNVLVNWMRRMRSKALAVRSLSDTTLAEAFWSDSRMWHIKPDFDQAMMDGEVELVLSGNLPLSAASAPVVMNSSTNSPLLKVASSGANVSSAVTTLGLNNALLQHGPGPSNSPPAALAKIDPNGTLQATLTGITAQMSASGVKLSLANIELAKQTAAFAKLREQFTGEQDDYILDLLMMGLRVPDEAQKQPILLDSKTTIFGYNERQAMDGANLDMSRTTGKTSVTLNFRTPPMNTGGFIVITSQIVPEQLFERQEDVFLGVTSPSNLPQFDRDFLDPEKVEVVQNKYVDVLHGTPTGAFGYAPLNHRWKQSITTVGGKYYRPTVDAFSEDRQRFWAVEQANPALNTDFYLVRSTLPHTVFADTVADPFEVVATGIADVMGLTVFGSGFEEKADHYAAVNAVVDKTRIVQA
jgi:hypothetical protein